MWATVGPQWTVAAITFSEKTTIQQVPQMTLSDLTSPAVHLEPDLILGPSVENQENDITATATDLARLKTSKIYREERKPRHNLVQVPILRSSIFKPGASQIRNLRFSPKNKLTSLSKFRSMPLNPPRVPLVASNKELRLLSFISIVSFLSFPSNSL